MSEISNSMILNNIKWLAKSKGILIGNLEKEVGVSKGYFSRLEKSIREMSLGTAAKVADVLGCTLDELVLTDIGRQIEIAELEKKLQALKVGEHHDT